MKYLHTMVRVTDLETSLDFYCKKLGLRELKRHVNEGGRFTLVFLAADRSRLDELEQAARYYLAWQSIAGLHNCHWAELREYSTGWRIVAWNAGPDPR